MNLSLSPLNRLSTFILRVALGAIGAGVLAICIFALPAMWRAVPAEYDSTLQPVFYWILSIIYVSAIPFFMALYQALRLLGLIDKNAAFSVESVKALKMIAYSGICISLLYTAMLPFMYTWAQSDDAPGLIVIDLIVVSAAFTVTVFAAVMQQLLKQAIHLKSENELTV